MLIRSLDNLNKYIMEAGFYTPTENDSASLILICNADVIYTEKIKLLIIYHYYVTILYSNKANNQMIFCMI